MGVGYEEWLRILFKPLRYDSIEDERTMLEKTAIHILIVLGVQLCMFLLLT